jgi:hypothetical protein
MWPYVCDEMAQAGAPHVTLDLSVTGKRTGNWVCREFTAEEESLLKCFEERASDMSEFVYKSNVYPFEIICPEKVVVKILTCPLSWGMSGDDVVAELGRDIECRGEMGPLAMRIIKTTLGVNVRLVANADDTTVLTDVERVQIGLVSCVVQRVHVQGCHKQAILLVSDAQAAFIRTLSPHAIFKSPGKSFSMNHGLGSHPVGSGLIGAHRDPKFTHDQIQYDHLAQNQFLAHPAFLCKASRFTNARNKVYDDLLECDPYSVLCRHHHKMIMAAFHQEESPYTDEDIVYWGNEMAIRFGRLWVPKCNFDLLCLSS